MFINNMHYHERKQLAMDVVIPHKNASPNYFANDEQRWRKMAARTIRQKATISVCCWCGSNMSGIKARSRARSCSSSERSERELQQSPIFGKSPEIMNVTTCLGRANRFQQKLIRLLSGR